ncbi:MAG: leucine--tRNA ligase [Phycisphaerales bacterium JB037]
MPEQPDTQSASRSPEADFRYTADRAGEIETRWQAAWREAEVFKQPNPGEPGFDAGKPKFYCLDMFPYPSGAGLHVGHPEGYTATDIICRYKRMKGFNVLHPMGWDAFGLPAEQYAIQTGVHPAETTRKAIDNFRRQLQRFGFSYDWSREFATIDQDYYRWTQWIFLKIYQSWFDPRANAARPIAELEAALERGIMGVNFSGEPVFLDDRSSLGPIEGEPVGVRQWHELTQDERRRVIDNQRLAYIDESTVNWCPKLGTALANEEVIDGKSERGGFPVFRKPLRQWLFRITRYGDRLIEGLEGLDWPESTRTMQREWIGRSTGAEIDFDLDLSLDLDGPEGRTVLRVYTTRPDTIFGATFMVVAPEHPLVDAVLTDPQPETDVTALRAYAEQARNRSDVERQESKEKTGVFTGAYAVNPATGGRIPIWTADYVLMGYGFGAIMAVPAHDERDFEFAEKFGLPIRDVVYTRPQLAMRWFCQNASAAERRPEKWAGLLADFLALVASRGVALAGFADALETVRTQRAESDEGSSVSVDPGESPTNEPESVGTRRGLGRIVWYDVFEQMKLHRLEDLAERFEAASFHRLAGTALSESGLAANSANDEVDLNGLSKTDAIARTIAWLEKSGRGRKQTNYRLRDWLFSRQRYWGEPFPIVFDAEGNHHAVSEESLPVTLPPLADYQPIESDDPQPLLAKATDWLRTTAGEAGVPTLDPQTPVVREANTMPGWAGSCWYHLRYTDAGNNEAFASRDAESYWMSGGVDLYIGGSEHAVLHLLYARFWHKVLHDLGHVSTDEPYRKLFHQGMILSHAFQRPDKSLVPVDEVDEKSEDEFIERATGQRVTRIVAKMSKSLKNVVNPDEVIADYGADTFRLYEMYMGPLEATKPWNTRDIAGLFRFCQRAWRLIIDDRTGDAVTGDAPDADLEKLLHRTIDKVAGDIERLGFNTAIAAMIEFVNAGTAAREKNDTRLTRDQASRFATMLSPFAPHLAQELWSRLGQPGFVCQRPWPEIDAALLVDDEVEIPVQIRGKVRHRITAPADASANDLEQLALADDKVQELIAGQTVRKVIAVPGKMVNIVV